MVIDESDLNLTPTSSADTGPTVDMDSLHAGMAYKRMIEAYSKIDRDEFNHGHLKDIDVSYEPVLDEFSKLLARAGWLFSDEVQSNPIEAHPDSLVTGAVRGLKQLSDIMPELTAEHLEATIPKAIEIIERKAQGDGVVLAVPTEQLEAVLRLKLSEALTREE